MIKQIQIDPKNPNNEKDNQQQSSQCNTTTQSSISSQASNINVFVQKFCHRCKNPLSDTDYYLQNCGQNSCLFKYHEACFFKELNHQCRIKQVITYKCSCGTKIPQRILRKCGAANKMELFSSIHRRQLEYLLTNQTLRKNKDIMMNYDQNKLKENELDYFLSRQDHLLFEETPQ